MLDLETLDVETASVLLGRFAVKQAAARVKQANPAATPAPTAKPDAGYFGPLLSNTLSNAGIGAAGGAGIAALMTALQRKKKKNWLANILFGAAGGAGLGGAYGAYTGMPAPKSVADRAAGTEGSKALQTQLGLSDNFTKQEVEAKLQSPDPAVRAAAEQLLHASGISVNTEPGALSDAWAARAGAATKGALIGGLVNTTGAQDKAFDYVKSKVIQPSNAAITEAFKKNPELPNFFRDIAGTAQAKNEAIKLKSDLAIEDARINSAATLQPKNERANFIREKKLAPEYLTLVETAREQEQLAVAAEASEKAMANSVQASRLKPVKNPGLLGKVTPTKQWELLDSTGQNITGHVGGPDKLKSLVTNARQQVKAAPRVPTAPGAPRPGMLGRGMRGGIGGAIAGAVLGPAIEGAAGHFFGNGQ